MQPTDFSYENHKTLEYLTQLTEHLHAQQKRLTMLTEIQMRQGKIEDIGGYAYGRTADGSPFIILYPAKPMLKHKICRVYKERFDKLPPFVSRRIPENAQEGNPDRDAAIRQGIYTETEPFQIAVFPGKETQMGNEVRFMTAIPPESNFTYTPPEPTRPHEEQAEIDYSNELQHRDEEGNRPTPETPAEIAIDGINNLLGLGESSADPKPQSPYKYKNDEPVADNPKTIAIYLAYWETKRKVAPSPDDLRNWYTTNKEYINATLHKEPTQ